MARTERAERARPEYAGRVALFLATHNGERFLPQQLESLDAQTHAEVDIYASDDGSTDRTPVLLNEAAMIWRKGRFVVKRGPGQGFAENFRSLLTLDVEADYLGFADQDDVWATDRIEAGVNALRPFGERPALYCGRTRLIDAEGKDIGLSMFFPRPTGFANALVQSIAGGNTMIFNRAAHRLLGEAARRTAFVSHDWFSYQIVSGAGGAVIYSHEPKVMYRQHGDNLMGSNRGLRPRLARLVAGLGGQFTDWSTRNIAALSACRDLLTPEAGRLLDQFAEARRAGLLRRLLLLRRAGLYRQTRAGQVSLHLAALLGKL